MSNTINPIHTVCKNCVFSEYEKNTQVSCFLGMIEKYREQDPSCILEVYDQDKEFYVINKRKCIWYKENKYFENREMSNASIEEKATYVKNTWKIKYLAVVDCRDRTDEDLNNIITTLMNSGVEPANVSIITSRLNKVDHQDFYKVLKKLDLKWTIKSLLHPEQEHITTVHQIVNEGAKKCNFILSIGQDHKDVEKIVKTANDMIYTHNKPFMVISNESKQTILFNVLVYRNGLLPEHKDIITNYEAYTII